jgi:glycosyltransferase involved in cell wall biosynthesis
MSAFGKADDDRGDRFAAWKDVMTADTGILNSQPAAVTSPEAVRPLRVLHVTDLHTENYYLNNLFDYTDPRTIRYSAVTFGSGGGFQASLQQRGCTTYAIGCKSRRLYPEAAKRIGAVIRNEKIDIVHTHLFEPSFVGVTVARLYRKPIVVTRHHSDAVHRIPARWKRKGYLLAEKWISRSADHIIAPSLMVRDVLVNRENVSASKVTVIPYPQTSSRFQLSPEGVARVRAELQMEGRLSMVCVCRLFNEKGHRFLFQALTRLSRQGLDFALYLVGTGPHREIIEAQARDFGIADRVRFLGWRDDALKIIGAADIVVHPSLQEALPSAVIESIMLERPLVATDVSGVRDVLGDNRHGLVVPPANADALGQAIIETIDHLDEARARARRGRDFVLDYMDAGRVSRDYVACYQKVASLPKSLP